MSTIWLPDLSVSEGPKYKALSTAIRRAICDGVLSCGDQLPPVREIAWEMQVTPGTVARAYKDLVACGVLEAVVGRGTFVAQPVAETSPIGIDAVVHDAAPSHRVSLFSPVLPDVGQAALIATLLAGIAAHPPSGLMHYPTRNGAQPAREAVLRWLQGVPLGPVGHKDVALSHGGQNAITLVLQSVLQGATPTVLVEEMCYPGFRRAAELLRAKVVPVAMDADGVIPQALEAAARSHAAQIFCTSPEIHNPTGGFTPTDRREALARVARQTDLHVLEDDCYCTRGEDRGPTYRMLLPDRGWYISSLAKSLTPSLRIGFAIAPEGHWAALRRSAEYGFFGLATPLSDLGAALLDHRQVDDLASQVRAVIDTYVQRAVNILGGHDLVWRAGVPFVWLTLPMGWRAGAFCQAAEAVEVQIRSAEEFAGRDARTPHAVRLAINAGVSLDSFEAALERLRVLLDNPPDQIGV